jgi:hypothetical protein
MPPGGRAVWGQRIERDPVAFAGADLSRPGDAPPSRPKPGLEPPSSRVSTAGSGANCRAGSATWRKHVGMQGYRKAGWRWGRSGAKGSLD